MTPNERAQELEERLIVFAVRILKVANALPKNYAGQHFASQIIRSGSSPALNYGEARVSESEKDFRHKMAIVLKELRETHINLRIIGKSSLLDAQDVSGVIDESNQLISIFVTAIRSIDAKPKK
ncbi:four helix bundle protein [Neolewinella lacunae]|uniref:Four helix bundle protein n=1 Tax=Neolewinella lacunae TaxID=1517758 RepID=A0A923PHP6_9BACT|nr:four helix bundle protein [Neolewinella lacunae]MBC6994275.1 four helix bundle protein [Neolewinella lacunae]MDN3635347.1 four helix bundle protein [Neolewinella lacunae]